MRLTMEGFGAFAGRQEVDFSALGRHRLFLICGPTGAGKTTLLDAMCFALFGESSGEPGRDRHLRSQAADPGKATTVAFEFGQAGRTWRIQRSPAWERPNRHGGTTAQGMKVALAEVTAAGVGAPMERAADVHAKVAELLGLNAAEFRQVVVLPQGRFRELLSAAPDDRQKILRTLFRTALFKSVQQHLSEAASTARQAFRDAQQRRRLLLEQAGAADETTVAAGRVGLAGAMATAELALGAARMAETTARAETAAAREAARKLAAAGEAREALAAIEIQTPAMETERKRLAAARRADQLGGAMAAADAADKRAATARSDAWDAATQAEAAEALAKQAAEALADASPRAESAHAMRLEAQRLLDRIEAVQAAEAAAAEASSAEIAAATARACQRTAESARRDAQTALHEAVQALADAKSVADQAAFHRLGVAAATARRNAGQERDKAADAVARAARACQIAADQEEAAKRALDAARQAAADAIRAVAADQAGHLAARLAAGAPCPVCGSTHHPMPAVPTGAEVPDATAAEARAREAGDMFDAARERRRQRETDAVLAASRRDAAITELGNVSASALADLDAAVNAGVGLFRAATEAQTALPGMEAARDAANTGVASAEAALADAIQEVSATANRFSAAIAKRDDRLGRLPDGSVTAAALTRAADEALTTAKVLEDTLARQREERDTANAAAQTLRVGAATDHGRAQQSNVEAQEAFDTLVQACKAAVFPDIETARAAVLPPAEQQAIGAALRSFDDQYASARTLAERTALGATNLAPPDLAAREAALDAASAETVRQADAATRARRALEEHDTLIVQIASAVSGSAAAEAEYAMRQDLADLAAGTGISFDFEGYVLAGLLDEALDAANRKLAGMLGGNFELRRTQERERANARAGLGIEVFDAGNAQTRPAATLSGGEGFCASLALALGLAETVAGHAGAQQLDALFVDEGFGTLDAATLDTAIRVLDDLQDGARMVGIISHVAELRERIPAWLEVTRGARGSTAAFRIG